MGQIPVDEVRRKQAYLGAHLRKRGITLKLHDPQTSLLEAAFARGDASLGRVIEKAVDLGCRFDGWSECFDFAKWDEAFRACGMDLATCAGRTFGLDEELPWGHIRSGVTDAFLKKEYQRAAEAAITGNCREECMHCGLGCRDGGSAGLGKPAVGTAQTPAPAPAKPSAAPPEITVRVRMRFSRLGRVRFLSHLDLMTLFHRAAVRAGVPVAYSQGFNPHPRIAFGPALSVGMESDAEYLDMDTDPFVDLQQASRDLNAALPEGLRIREMRAIPKNTSSLSGRIGRYIYEVSVPSAHGSELPGRLQSFLENDRVIVEKDGKLKDIRPGIAAISLKGPALVEITIQDTETSKPRIQDVVEKLFAATREQALQFGIRRTAMFMKAGDGWKGPLEAV
jgi:radical SAM-linked protein